LELKSCIKIAYGRCEAPETTVVRLEKAVGARDDYRYYEEKVSDQLYWSALFIDELEFRSMGKGISPVFSKAGALAECAEWMAASDVHLLPGYETAHPRDIAGGVGLGDLLAHVSTVTPEVLCKVEDSECARHWVDGFSLMHGRTLKVPIEFVRRINAPNGRASGNRLEEAIVHATNEVFERRAHITVLRNRMVMPTIDPATVKNPIIQAQMEFVRSKGIEFVLKDLSFGGVLPCVGAYFFDPAIPREFQFHHFFKVGASFNREDALTRVFTEYVQGRRADEFVDGRPGERERVLGHDFRSLKCMAEDEDNFLSAFMFGFVPYADAEFMKQGPVVPFEEGECFDDCLQDIEKAKEICRTLGKDYIVVDFTDPKIGFPVVQVVIPGYSDVLPFHPRWSPILFRTWSREDVINAYEKQDT